MVQDVEITMDKGSDVKLRDFITAILDEREKLSRAHFDANLREVSAAKAHVDLRLAALNDLHNWAKQQAERAVDVNVWRLANEKLEDKLHALEKTISNTVSTLKVWMIVVGICTGGIGTLVGHLLK